LPQRGFADDLQAGPVPIGHNWGRPQALAAPKPRRVEVQNRIFGPPENRQHCHLIFKLTFKTLSFSFLKTIVAIII
jgi:hypothetical protein